MPSSSGPSGHEPDGSVRFDREPSASLRFDHRSDARPDQGRTRHPGSAPASSSEPSTASSAEPGTASSSVPATASGQGRALWIDALRGIAVLLVIVWHGLVIGDDQSIQHGAVWEASVLLQGMRMPTLFLLSGLLLPHALAKPVGSYVRGKWANVVWPYLLWQLVAILEAPDLSLFSIASWGPGTYLWFMFYLGVYFAAALLLRWMPPAAMLAVALIIFAMASVLAEPGTQPMRLAIYGVWFFGGAVIGRHLVRAAPGVTWLRAFALACFAIAGWLFIGFAGLPVNPEADPWVFLVVSLSTTACAVLIALMFFQHRFFAALHWVGRHSVVFYVAHFAVQMPLILALQKSEVDAGTGALIGSVAAVAACTVLASLRRFRIVDALFSFPLPRR